MATNTQKLSISLRKKLNDALAEHRSKARTFHGKVRSEHGNTAQGNVDASYVREQLAGGLPVHLAALRTEANENIATAEAAYQRAYDQATIISTASDTTQALLDETRAGKIWSRLERELTAKNASAGDIIANALENGDRLTRAVVLAEFPSWGKANGVAVSLGSYADKLVPELADARKEVNDAVAYRNIVDSNVGKIERATERNLTDPIASVDDIGTGGGSSYLDPDVTIYG